MFSSIPLAAVLFTSKALSYSPSGYNFDPLKHLAGVAPPFLPLDPPLDPAPPQGCNVTRAGYLVRHAAIFANDFDYETYIQPFVQKLGNTSVDWSKVPNLSFLATWQNPITDAEQEMLTRAGKMEAVKLGVDVAQRYQSLRIPQKIFSSTAERTVKSAKSFSSGLALDEAAITVDEISEGAQEGANSLTPYESCPAYSSSAGGDQSTVRLPMPHSSSMLTHYYRHFLEYMRPLQFFDSIPRRLLSILRPPTSMPCHSFADMKPSSAVHLPSVTPKS
jgi:acid phosphatase